MQSDRVFKTLIVKLASGQLVVAIVPVIRQVDLKAVAAAFQTKSAAMAEPAEAERSSGYVVGGISPLGQRKTLSTVIDETVLHHGTVLVSGGRRGLMLEIAPPDLVKLCNAITAAISK
jgi:Cys-tRNA(Pro)/Cys-tRNA(Cys) deacylase